MPTEEELEKTYSQMATEDLLYMMACKGDYIGEAIDAATKGKCCKGEKCHLKLLKQRMSVKIRTKSYGWKIALLI